MLTAEEETRVADMLELGEDNPRLSQFHRGFLFGDAKSREKGFKSIKEQYDEFGMKMRITDKQWKILREIEEKLE